MSDAISHAALAVSVMQAGDGRGVIEKITQRQLSAEAAFARKAYGAWTEFPIHPAAPAFAAWRRYLAGERTSPAAFRGLSHLGGLLDRHRSDWADRATEVGARLRGTRYFNFFGCLFELEASVWLRTVGRYETVWLWPTRPKDGDVLVDGTVWTECVHAGTTDRVRVPHHYGAQLAAGLVGDMDKRNCNLHVRVIVQDRLVGKDISVIQSELRRAIHSGQLGSIPLSVAGYRAEIVDLAPGERGVSEVAARTIMTLFASLPHKWGHVKRNSLIDLCHPQVVTIHREQADTAIAIAARAAADKHAQLTAGRPNLVCVNFGLPVPHEQAIDPMIQLAVSQAVLAALHDSQAHRVSGVLWVFDTAILFPRPGLGILDEEPDPKGFRQVAFPIRNPAACTPLPDNF